MARNNKTKQKAPRKWSLCCVHWGLHWSVAHILSDASVEKAYFPFSSRCQLQIPSESGAGLSPIFWVSLCDSEQGFCLVWTYACLMYIVTVLCVHPVASGRQQFLGVLHHIWLLQFSLFLFCIIPEPWGDNVGKDFPFSTDYSKVPCSLHVIWLWSPLLTAIYSKKKRLWRGLNNALLLGTAICH